MPTYMNGIARVYFLWTLSQHFHGTSL